MKPIPMSQAMEQVAASMVRVNDQARDLIKSRKELAAAILEALGPGNYGTITVVNRAGGWRKRHFVRGTTYVRVNARRQ